MHGQRKAGDRARRHDGREHELRERRENIAAELAAHVARGRAYGDGCPCGGLGHPPLTDSNPDPLPGHNPPSRNHLDGVYAPPVATVHRVDAKIARSAGPATVGLEARDSQPLRPCERDDPAAAWCDAHAAPWPTDMPACLATTPARP